MPDLSSSLLTLPAGEVLFREGEPGDQMFVLQSGRVRLTRQGYKGPELLATVGPGEFFGEMAIINNRCRGATAEVIETAKLLVLDAQTFETMLAKNAEIAVRMILQLASRLDEANARIEILLHRAPMTRLILALLRQADLIGVEQDEDGVLVPLEREDLPKLAGLNAHEVDDVMSRLSRLGMLEDGDLGIVIKDRGRLTEFLDFTESPSLSPPAPTTARGSG
jgi:CRP-like cAMP-binding protein